MTLEGEQKEGEGDVEEAEEKQLHALVACVAQEYHSGGRQSREREPEAEGVERTVQNSEKW